MTLPLRRVYSLHMDIISRKDALAQGLKHYFTGKPCKRGHLAKRSVSYKGCKECEAERSKARYQANSESDKARVKAWYAANKEQARNYNKEYYSLKREVICAQKKTFYAANKTAALKRSKAWSQANSGWVLSYMKAKYHANPQHRAAVLLRNRLNSVLSSAGAIKSARTLELLGTDKAGLIAHLEAQFQPGMTWENQGQWHIDHIRPCASFDLTDPEQQRECFHFTNLQPLWGSENCSKGARLDWEPAAA